MILSNVDIKKALSDKIITITPLPEDDQFSSSALDLRIDDEFKEYDPAYCSQDGVTVEVSYSSYNHKNFTKRFLKDVPLQEDGSVIIKPKILYLAQTLEKIRLPIESQLAARIEGRSSFARLGLVVHLSAPTIHAGFPGKITLEIINHGLFNIRLYPKKDRICQLIFEVLASKATMENKSIFQNQGSVTGERRKTRRKKKS